MSIAPYLRPANTIALNSKGSSGIFNAPDPSWNVSTKQHWEHGYKAVTDCEAVSGLIPGYRFFTAKVHELNGFRFPAV